MPRDKEQNTVEEDGAVICAAKTCSTANVNENLCRWRWEYGGSRELLSSNYQAQGYARWERRVGDASGFVRDCNDILLGHGWSRVE